MSDTVGAVGARLKTGAVRIGAAAVAHKALAGAGGVAVLALGVVLFVKRRRAAAIGAQVVEKLKGVLGVPYIWGSRDPSVGLDCSGAIVYALRALGLEPKGWNATARDLHAQAAPVLVPQVGDLVFYGPILGDVDHVMVYTGDGRVIGASGGGPKTKTAADARARNAAVKLLPVTYRSDFRGYGRLPVRPVADAQVGALHMLGRA